MALPNISTLIVLPSKYTEYVFQCLSCANTFQNTFPDFVNVSDSVMVVVAFIFYLLTFLGFIQPHNKFIVLLLLVEFIPDKKKRLFSIFNCQLIAYEVTSTTFY